MQAQCHSAKLLILGHRVETTDKSGRSFPEMWSVNRTWTERQPLLTGLESGGLRLARPCVEAEDAAPCAKTGLHCVVDAVEVLLREQAYFVV